MIAPLDTTVDTLERVLIGETFKRVHWATLDGKKRCGAPGYVSLMTGSAAAITCVRCRRAFEKERLG